MGQHVLMGTMSTHVTVWMVTWETTVRNKMIATLTTNVPMEERVLMRMATILAAVNHLGLEISVNVMNLFTHFS